ncbi:MAG: glycoside hydrolase, partial [Bacilli bacterium]
TYWWGWGTLKLEDEVRSRMLTEFLYNTPPLYHLDDAAWALNKEKMITHTSAWQKFSEQATRLPMTDYSALSEDGKVATTLFGDSLRVVVNRTDQDAEWEGRTLKPWSVLIIDGGDVTEYRI